MLLENVLAIVSCSVVFRYTWPGLYTEISHGGGGGGGGANLRYGKRVRRGKKLSERLRGSRGQGRVGNAPPPPPPQPP